MLVPWVATKREGPLDLVGDVPHGGGGQRLGDEVAPEAGTGGAHTGDLPGELAYEVGTAGAEHHRHHERAGAVRVFHNNAVHLGDGLGEQRARLEERGGLHPGERERGCHTHGRHYGGRADGCPTRGDGGEVATFEDGNHLRGRRVRLAPADRADVREHHGALDGEYAVDASDQLGVYGDIFAHGG
jgi:hypothetical protein